MSSALFVRAENVPFQKSPSFSTENVPKETWDCEIYVNFRKRGMLAELKIGMLSDVKSVYPKTGAIVR